MSGALESPNFSKARYARARYAGALRAGSSHLRQLWSCGGGALRACGCGCRHEGAADEDLFLRKGSYMSTYETATTAGFGPATDGPFTGVKCADPPPSPTSTPTQQHIFNFSH